MRLFYTFLLYLMLPVFIGHLVRRGLKAPAYWQRWPERLGTYKLPANEQVFWVHAVSVGEVQASLPLIQRLRDDYPQHDILVTTTTPTGSDRVREMLGDDVLHVYAPYDLPFVIRRFLKHFQPRLAIIMETEIWPNTYYHCRKHGIPLIMANARMSKRSLRGYRRLGPFTRQVLAMPNCIAAQTQKDAARLEELGADASRIEVTGSVKIDVKLPASLHEQAQVLRRDWGVERTVWIAASTHEGEENVLLEAYDELKAMDPELLLVIVPRHPERFARVAALCQKRDLNVVLRSENRACDNDTDVFIGDSMGELAMFYAASDIAFVGGSLVRHGGQNLLEPAALGKPVVVGPHMFNFAEITRMMIEAGAAQKVKDKGSLIAAMWDLLRDANLRHSVGDKGRQLVEDNRGAVERLMGVIRNVLQNTRSSSASY